MNNLNYQNGRFGRFGSTGYSGLFFAIAVLALLFRLFASGNLPFNAYESAMVLDQIGHAITVPQSLSMIESILIRATFFLFAPSDLGARIWPILAGTAIVLIPFTLRDKIHHRLALILSMGAAFEPFLLVNSIQVGSNIFAVLGLTLFLSALWKRDKVFSLIGALVLLLSGRGLLPATLIVCVIFFADRKFTWEIFPAKMSIKDGVAFIKTSTSSKIILSFMVGAILIFQMDLSMILVSFSAYFHPISSLYFASATFSGMAVALLSYSPALLILFILFTIESQPAKKSIKGMLLGLALLFSIISYLTPGKTYFDGIWVAIPLLLGAGCYVEKRLQNLEWDARDTLFFGILLVVLISFTMSFFQFIYQGRYGYSQVTMVINFATMLLMLILGYLAFLFWGSGRQYVKNLSTAFLVLLLCLQISFSFRAAGVTTDKTAEFLWPGSMADREIVISVLKIREETKGFVEDKISIGIEKDLSPQLFWILKDANVTAIPNDLRGPAPYDLVISGNDSLEIEGKYIGQSFAAKKHPKWIENPLRSLFDYDYWLWLLFRNSTMSSINNTMWYAMD